MVVTGSVALLHRRCRTWPFYVAERELVMDLSQPAQSAPLPPSAAPVRPAMDSASRPWSSGSPVWSPGVSFVLFPLALVGGLVGPILGIIALARGKNRGATNTGQGIAGVVCCAVALVISVDSSVRVGTWAARNLGVFARFDNASPRPPTGPMSPPASPASPTRSGPRTHGRSCGGLR